MSRNCFSIWRVSLLLLCVVLLPFVAVGQTGGKPLTDDDVISMVRGGLAESTVISAIAAQDTHFDVSAAALIKLKQQGVSPNIMNAMLAAARRQSPSETPLLPPQNFPNQTPPALPSAAPPRSVSSAARANSVMEEILGSWQGVYFLYPQDMRIDLELRRAPSPAGESITGEFRFEPLVQEQRNFSGTFQGSYQISGQYDSSSRTLALNPGQWIQRPNQPVVGLKMTGVFDARKGIVAGTFSGPSNPNGTVLYFGRARPDRGWDVPILVVDSDRVDRWEVGERTYTSSRIGPPDWFPSTRTSTCKILTGWRFPPRISLRIATSPLTLVRLTTN